MKWLKRSIANLTKNQSLVDFLLIAFLGFHVFMGFKKNLLYIGGDTGVPMNPIKNLNLLYLWQNQEAGTVWWTLTTAPQLFFFALFEFLGFSLVATQRLYIYFAHTLAGLSIYYLVNSFSLERKRMVALMASVFYMFSPWIINYLGIFVFLPYSVMPLILGLFVRGLSGKMGAVKSVVLIVLAFLGIIINFPQYSMYFITVLLMALYWVFYLVVVRGDFWRSFKFILLLALVLFLSSTWFILPYLSSFSLGGVTSEIEVAAKISTSYSSFGDFGFATILHLLRMFGAAGFMAGGATYSQPYLDNPLLIAVSYLIPILVFSAILLRPRSKSVLFFTLVAIVFIFIAKGVNAPFGKLHFWLVTRFPLARAFRTTWNLSIGANIAYAFLFGVVVAELSSRIGKRTPKYALGLIVLIIIFVFINSWPLLTGDYFKFKWNPPTFGGVEIPGDYYELEDYLAEDKADFRFFRLPASEGMITTDWGYFGSDFSFSMFTTPSVSNHPLARASSELSQGVYDSIQDRRRLDEDALRTLSLLGVKYIIIDDHDKALKLKPQEIVALQSGFDIRSKFGKIDVLRLGDEYLLPHFYAAKKIIYTNASSSDFVKVIGLPGHQIRSGVVKIESVGDSLVKEGKMGEVVIKSDPFVSLAVENEKQRQLDGMESMVEGVFFPYAKWRPGTLWHSLVLKKEAWEVRAAGEKPANRAERNLFFAAKRIAELERWGGFLDEQEWRETALRYGQSMAEVFDGLAEVNRQGDEELFVSLLSKTQTSVLAHRKKLDQAFSLYEGSFEKKAIIDEHFSQIEERLEVLNRLPDLFTLNYNFYLPQEGHYEIFLKEEGGFSEKMLAEINQLKIDGQSILSEELFFKEGMVGFDGKVRAFEKGHHSLEISFREETDLLSENDWRQRIIPLFEVKEGLMTFRFPQFSHHQESPIAHQEVQEYLPNTYYLLSFDYLAKDGQLGIAIVQDVDIDAISGTVSPLVLRYLPASKEDEFQPFKTLFKSSADSQLAEIHLLVDQEKGELGAIECKNFRLQPIVGPSAIFKSAGLPAVKTEYQIPKITFLKINPTKYKVKIEAAKEPYLLVFSESFHPSWKVYKGDKRESTSYGPNIASYFDGEIKEGPHRDIFLDTKTFETWGQEPIAGDRHYPINGYANSWLIMPDDVNREGDYELIIEFQAQRMFYLGLAVSIGTFLSCLGYLAYMGIKNVKN